jgi:predicted nucleotide-binding protein
MFGLMFETYYGKSAIPNIIDMIDATIGVLSAPLEQGQQEAGVTGMTIFIGHGKSPVWRELRHFLEKRLHLSVDEFNSVPVAGIPTAIRLEEMLNAAAFAFLVMTAEDALPDDGQGLAGDPYLLPDDGLFDFKTQSGVKAFERPGERIKLHARLNVIHEAGLFQGRLGFKKAIILLEDGCEEFSNIHGLGQIRFPKGKINAKFEEIRQVLERESTIWGDAGGADDPGRGGQSPLRESAPATSATVTSSADTSSVEPPLPPNAKFRYQGKVFWVVPRRYTKDEAEDMRAAVREAYDCINIKSAPLVASYDGPAAMFMRNWIAIIQGQGPQCAIAKLDAIRSQVRAAHTELQEILERRPYHRQDIMKIIDDRGDSGNINSALNDYIEALKVLPEKPSVDLIKLAVGAAENTLTKCTDGYTKWIGDFNTKMMLIREELEALME